MLNYSNSVINYIIFNEVIFCLLTPKLIEMQKWDRFLQESKNASNCQNHQIRLCTKQLSFSKHLVLLFDEDLYIHKLNDWY